MKRKIISMVLILSLAFNTVGQTAIAYNKTNSNTGLIKLDDKGIEKCVKDVALEWAETVKPDVDFTLGEFKEINVVDSDDPEYTVSYFSNALPYGYAVVVFQNNEAIVKEANINPGQEGIYTDLVDTVIDVTDTSRKKLDIDKQIVELAPMQYGVVAKKKSDKRKKIYDNYRSEMSLDDLSNKSSKYADIESIYIYNLSNNNYKVSEKTILKKYKNKSRLFTQGCITDRTSRFCCCTSAAYQIAYMEGLATDTDHGMRNAYNYLWENSGVKVYKTQLDIDYGSCNTRKTKNALVDLAKKKGYKGTENYWVKNEPSVSWLKDKLKYNRPILMGYGINVGGKRQGHEISVLGLIRAKKVSSGKTYNYLMVYDTWHNSPTYINYTTVDFTNCDAAYFWVKKK